MMHVALLFPFHTTSKEYTQEQTRVHHDRSDCPEAMKIQVMHRIDGSGARPRCKECARLDIVVSKR